MKLKFIAHPQGPEKYSFSGEIVTAFVDGQFEQFDLSECEEGGKFPTDWKPELLNMPGTDIIPDCQRIDGELHVIVVQRPPVTKVTYSISGKTVSLKPTAPPPEEYDRKTEWRGGRWKESDWIDSGNYAPETIYIQEA